MDLNTVTMDRDEAVEKAADYRTLKAPNDEDKGLIAAFTALAAGKQIIDLPATIAGGGSLDDRLRPRLAVLRSSARWCYLYRDWHGNVEYRTSNTGRRNVDTVDVGKVVDVVALESWSRGCRGEVRCQVPIVPPQHRIRGFRSMLVLWEVEEWAKAPRPPGDPALLRHLVGPLYTVEAVWDLTEIERLVLGRRT